MYCNNNIRNREKRNKQPKKVRKPSLNFAQKEELIRKMVSRNYSLEDLAHEYNVNTTTLYRLNKIGIEKFSEYRKSNP